MLREGSDACILGYIYTSLLVGLRFAEHPTVRIVLLKIWDNIIIIIVLKEFLCNVPSK